MSGGCWRSPARPCSAPLCPRLPDCLVPTGPGAPSPARHPRAHARPRSLRTQRAGRLVSVGAAAPTLWARGRRACTGVRRSARSPRSLRTWETPAGLRRTGHRLRTREGHQRCAPGSRPRPPPDHLLPPVTPCGLLTSGTDAAAETGRGEATSGVPHRPAPAAARGTTPDRATMGRPRYGLRLRGRAAPARGTPALVQRSPHFCGATHAA